MTKGSALLTDRPNSAWNGPQVSLRLGQTMTERALRRNLVRDWCSITHRIGRIRRGTGLKLRYVSAELCTEQASRRNLPERLAAGKSRSRASGQISTPSRGRPSVSHRPCQRLPLAPRRRCAPHAALHRAARPSWPIVGRATSAWPSQPAPLRLRSSWQAQ